MTRALAICCLLLVTSVREAAAEWQFTPMVGLTMFGRTSIVDPEGGTGKRHWNFGGAVSLVGSGILGVEGLTVWTPGFFEHDDLDLVRSSRTVSVMANVVLTTPRRWTEYSLRPFVSGGLGLIHLQKIDEGLFTVDSNLAGFNIGGGAIGFLTDRTGLRFDFRYHSTLTPTDVGPVSFGDLRLRYVTATVGLVFRASPVR